MKLKIETISCAHCVKTITQAILAADKSANVNIDLKTKIVEINSSLNQTTILSLLDDIGYNEVDVI